MTMRWGQYQSGQLRSLGKEVKLCFRTFLGVWSGIRERARLWMAKRVIYKYVGQETLNIGE